MAREHPCFARLYRSVVPVLDRAGLDVWRRKLLSGVHGNVLEIGAGAGSNFPHYPSTVTEVVAVEPESLLRDAAQRNVPQASVPVQVMAGRAEDLPFATGTFDAVVTTLVLCSVDEVAVALAEIRRVLVPGGTLLVFEHVRAQGRAAQTLQGALDATVWPRMFGGCHTSRDLVAALTASGFDVGGIRRVRIPERGIGTPVSPHIFGHACST